MKNKKKICVVISNRASYSRVKSFLIAATRHKKVDLKIIILGSSILDKYGDITKILKQDNLKIADKLFTIIESDNPIAMAKTTSITLNELSSSFLRLKPNVVVVAGDRYENLAIAIAASYMNIRVAHIQGGEVTGTIDESVRHAITKLSHLHFACTKRSKKFLIKMGEHKKNVFMTGCPSLDIIKNLNRNIDKNFGKRNSGIGSVINYKKKYIVVLFHPVTTEYKQTKKHIDNLIKAIHLLDNNIQIVILWPNVDSGKDIISKSIRILMNKKKNYKVIAHKNLDPEDYIRLIFNSSCLVGNSSSGIRECSYLGSPAVNIGTRQQNRERGKNIVDVDNQTKNILKGIYKQLKVKKFKKETIYGDGKSGQRILKILIKAKTPLQKTLNYLK